MARGALCPWRRQRRPAVRPCDPVDARHAASPGDAQRELGGGERRQLRRHRRSRHGDARARRRTTPSRSTPPGLQPASVYYYRFTSARSASPVGRTKTLPVGNVAQAAARRVLVLELPGGLLQCVRRTRPRRTDIDVGRCTWATTSTNTAPLGYASQIAVAIDREVAAGARDHHARPTTAAATRSTAPTPTCRRCTRRCR